MAMVEALAAGVIDIVGSFHTPQDEEEKRLPFEEAASGAVGLETLLPAAMQLHHAGHLSLPALWRALALNPARLLGLDGRAARGRGAGRSRALRPRHALRPRPGDAALEVEEHALRPPPDAGPGAAHLGRGPRGLRGRMTLAVTFSPRLSPRLDPLRRARHPGARPRRPSRHRLGQHRRDQRAPHRQQGRRRRDADPRRRQGRRRRAASPAPSPARARRWSPASPPSSATSSRSGSASAAARASRPSSASCSPSPGRPASPPALTWLATAFAFRFSSLAALVAAASTPLWLWVFGRADAVWLGVALAVLVFVRHHANIRRLLAGTEPRIGKGK